MDDYCLLNLPANAFASVWHQLSFSGRRTFMLVSKAARDKAFQHAPLIKYRPALSRNGIFDDVKAVLGARKEMLHLELWLQACTTSQVSELLLQLHSAQAGGAVRHLTLMAFPPAAHALHLLSSWSSLTSLALDAVAIPDAAFFAALATCPLARLVLGNLVELPDDASSAPAKALMRACLPHVTELQCFVQHCALISALEGQLASLVLEDTRDPVAQERQQHHFDHVLRCTRLGTLAMGVSHSGGQLAQLAGMASLRHVRLDARQLCAPERPIQSASWVTLEYPSCYLPLDYLAALPLGGLRALELGAITIPLSADMSATLRQLACVAAALAAIPTLVWSEERYPQLVLSGSNSLGTRSRREAVRAVLSGLAPLARAGKLAGVSLELGRSDTLGAEEVDALADAYQHCEAGVSLAQLEVSGATVLSGFFARLPAALPSLGVLALEACKVGPGALPALRQLCTTLARPLRISVQDMRVGEHLLRLVQLGMELLRRRVDAVDAGAASSSSSSSHAGMVLLEAGAEPHDGGPSPDEDSGGEGSWETDEGEGSSDEEWVAGQGEGVAAAGEASTSRSEGVAPEEQEGGSDDGDDSSAGGLSWDSGVSLASDVSESNGRFQEDLYDKWLW